MKLYRCRSFKEGKMKGMFSLYFLFFSMALASGQEASWKEYHPSSLEKDWEIKEDGFHSRRLSKKALKKIEAKEECFVIESHYQSRGKFLCSKQSYTNFILEAEVKVNDLRSGAFIAYHGQFLDKTWKNQKKPYSALHGFYYSFGIWPKTSGEAEIRYARSKSLVPEHLDVELKKDTWHQVKIVVKDETIQHWFDGRMVAELTQVRETLKQEKLEMAKDPLKGFLVLGMNGHPKGQRQVIRVAWRKVRVREL